MAGLSVQLIIVLLAIDAAWVAVRQYRHGDRKAGVTWALIVVYWVLLTAKNVIDFAASAQ